MNIRAVIGFGLLAMGIGFSAWKVAAAPAPLEAEAQAAPPCYVQLWDHHYFGGDSVILHGPGRWPTLRDLIDISNTRWKGEADSLKVSAGASVRVWDGEDFESDAHLYGPLTEQANLKVEPKSLEIVCE